MAISGKHPSVEVLQQLHILKTLPADQLALLARSLLVKEAPRGKKVLELGAEENFSFYLLDGVVALRAKDGNVRKISHKDNSALNPLARLIPRLYDIIAITTIEYIQVDNVVLAGLTQHPEVMPEMTEERFLEHCEIAEGSLKECLSNDLANEQLYLPTLPDVAVRIANALEKKVTDAEVISRILQTDMAMTAKIIRVANSAMYASRIPVESCTTAVVRLGVQTIRRLVLSFALRELFHTNSAILQGYMKSLWTHSTQVAAVCYVLAKETGQFNPEQAMLAGLLHDIGEVAILTYAEKFPDVANDEEQLKQVLSDMRGKVGSMILHSWGFLEELVYVTEEAENWLRDPSEEPDYADLVIVAQLSCFIGTPRMLELPQFADVPATGKLGLGEFTPEMSVGILDQAVEFLAETKTLLGS